MPLPLILGIAAGIAAVSGVGAGISGGVKMKEANDTLKDAQARQKKAVEKFESTEKISSDAMDRLGRQELNVLKSFDRFSNVFEKIHNKPQFKEFQIGNVKIPEYNAEEIKQISIGATALLSGIGSGALGSAAATGAVAAIGAAVSHGAIGSLVGVAATNHFLATLGGGALVAGGGGVALGSAILGGATLGVGLLIGGIVFNVTGSKLSDKADEAMQQARKTENDVEKICSYLNELKRTANSYGVDIHKVNKMYLSHLNALTELVDKEQDWNRYSNNQRAMAKNTYTLVILLYNMCKVQLVLQTDEENGINKINYAEIDSVRQSTNQAIAEKNIAAIAAN